MRRYVRESEVLEWAHNPRQAQAKAVVDRWYHKPWKQRLAGGLAVGKRPSDFSKKALVEGIIVELEHTEDPEVAMEIAMDHLVEDKQYYKKLKTIEKHANVGSLKRELSR